MSTDESAAATIRHPATQEALIRRLVEAAQSLPHPNGSTDSEQFQALGGLRALAALIEVPAS